MSVEGARLSARGVSHVHIMEPSDSGRPLAVEVDGGESSPPSASPVVGAKAHQPSVAP